MSFGGWDLPCVRWQLLTILIPLQLPILLKGTSDDDTPCPGYLFEEIASILLHCSRWQGQGRVNSGHPVVAGSVIGIRVGSSAIPGAPSSFSQYPDMCVKGVLKAAVPMA